MKRSIGNKIRHKGHYFIGVHRILYQNRKKKGLLDFLSKIFMTDSTNIFKNAPFSNFLMGKKKKKHFKTVTNKIT